MLGPRRQHQPELFVYDFNLEERIPSEHPLRRVRELIDLSFVRPAVARFYGYNGHRSEDPELILKLMFLLFFDNVASERELMRQIGYRMDYLWFLGLGVQDSIPHHSVLSKARRRWGREVFEALFVQTVQRCVQAGLVEGGKIHMDGSLVDANAGTDSVLTGAPELIEQLRAVYRQQEKKLSAVQQERARYHQRANDRMASRTDPEAPVVKQSRGQKARPRYKHHRAVDNQCGVITAVETTPGDVAENHRLAELVRQHQRTTGKRVETVVADRQYGTQQNLAWCARRQIQAHLAEWPQRTAKGIFAESDFVYDAERDAYRCPAGQWLLRQPGGNPNAKRVYRAAKAICHGCALYRRCTRSRKGGIRKIYRHPEQAAVDRARAQSRSAAARRDRLRRKHLMEGSFADATHHHFKRARWRGLWRQQIQDWLIAVCQNTRIWLRHSRLRPAGAAAAVRANSFDPWAQQSVRRRLHFLYHQPAQLLRLIRRCIQPSSERNKSNKSRLLGICGAL